MEDFITWLFTVLNKVWTMIRGSWVLSLFVLIGVLGWIVDLINNSRSQ